MGGEKNKKDNNNKKESAKESKNVTVVLKTDLHCEGCASKIVKCLRSFDDVETVSVDESAKITVVGKVDPVKMKEKLEQKTHKKVELISPLPKKEKEKEKEKSNENKDDDKENSKSNNNTNKKQSNKNEKDKDKNVKDLAKSDEKKGKAKVPQVTTAVFKVYLHCQGCIQKIHKLVSKTKGYEDVKIDKQKDLVTVTGSMDMKALAEVLKKHLKRDVDIVPPKKEEKKENGEKGKDGGKEKGNAGGGDGGGKGKGNNGGKEKGNGGENMEGNQMQVRYSYPNPLVYGSGSVEPQFHYNPYPVGGFNAPQMFSDENPNACNVM